MPDSTRQATRPDVAMQFSIEVVESMRHVPDRFWSSQSTPFMQRAFWLALEESGAIGAQAGWFGQHLILYQADQLVAVLPLFVKSHNRGEYGFDHAWAQAYARH